MYFVTDKTKLITHITITENTFFFIILLFDNGENIYSNVTLVLSLLHLNCYILMPKNDRTYLTVPFGYLVFQWLYCLLVNGLFLFIKERMYSIYFRRIIISLPAAEHWFTIELCQHFCVIIMSISVYCSILHNLRSVLLLSISSSIDLSIEIIHLLKYFE